MDRSLGTITWEQPPVGPRAEGKDQAVCPRLQWNEPGTGEIRKLMQLSGLKCGHLLRGHQEPLEGPLRVSRNITFFCHGERYAWPSFRQCRCDHLVSARHWRVTPAKRATDAKSRGTQRPEWALRLDHSCGGEGCGVAVGGIWLGLEGQEQLHRPQLNGE